MLTERSAVTGFRGCSEANAIPVPFVSSGADVMVDAVAPSNHVHACLARAPEPPVAPNPNP